jgi:hypothetical protein
MSNPYYLIRVAWQNAPSISDPMVDIGYVRVTEFDNQYNKKRDIKVTDKIDDILVNLQMRYTRCLQIDLSFYGPNAFDHAQKVRDYVFYPDADLTLAKQNLYLIPTVAHIRRLPETFNKQWWERSDMTIQFNNLVIRNFSVPFFVAASIIIMNESGTIANIDIEQLHKESMFTDTTASQWAGTSGSDFEKQ